MIGTLRDGAVLGIDDGSTLGDITVVGIGDGTTLRYGAVVDIGDGPLGDNVVRALVGRDIASIPCRVLMACIFSYPTANGDAGDGLLSASARSYTDWRDASVENSFGNGKLCGKINCLGYLLRACGWDINGVESESVHPKTPS